MGDAAGDDGAGCPLLGVLALAGDGARIGEAGVAEAAEACDIKATTTRSKQQKPSYLCLAQDLVTKLRRFRVSSSERCRSHDNNTRIRSYVGDTP